MEPECGVGAVKKIELLPENWESVVDYRMRKYKSLYLSGLYANKLMIDECSGCPLLRMVLFQSEGEDMIFSCCNLYGNKCIKQYPHRIDNKEFK